MKNILLDNTKKDRMLQMELSKKSASKDIDLYMSTLGGKDGTRW